MLRKLALTLVLLGLMGQTASAAQLIAKPKNHTVAAIYASQTKNYEYARYLCNNGRHATKLWGCKAVKWLRREMQETYKVLHPVIITSGGYTGLSSIRYAVASCESGGNPHNTHNPKYRGKWQFDQSTWNKFAPKAYYGVDPAIAPESVQDEAALAVTYDAWPNC